MEKNISKANKIIKIIKILEPIYPNVKTDLIHFSPFELLIATILSAQCTDKRVNMVTPVLFSKYPSPETLAIAGSLDVENIIMTTGFYKNKTKNIIAASEMLVNNFNCVVPSSMDELTSLPGVGRKTANCVLGTYFEPQGIVVDTHIIRISNLLGVVETKNAEKIEKQLMDVVPKKYWAKFSHLFIKHGRNICIARRPKCSKCPISKHCEAYIKSEFC